MKHCTAFLRQQSYFSNIVRNHQDDWVESGGDYEGIVA